MRLNLTDGATGPTAFDLAERMSDLGYFTRLGAWISAVPDAEYPWDPDIVKAIRREFDPYWTPLFAREAWYTPAKTLLISGRHMVARYVPLPHSEVDVLRAYVPFDVCHGIRFRKPLLEAMTLEIRAAPDKVEEETGGMVRRELGRYVPFDNRVYLTCKAMWKQNQKERIKDLVREVDYLQNDVPKQASRSAMEDLRADLKDDWKRLERIRKSETDYDRNKAMAPPPTRPSVLVGKAAGVKGAAA